MNRYHKYFPRRKLRAFKLFAAMIVFLVLYLLADARIQPYVRALASDSANTIALNAINEAVFEILDENKTDYSSLAIIDKSESGTINSIRVDAIKMNMLKTEINKRVKEKIENVKDRTIKISIGSVAGSDILTGRGPKLSYKLSMSGYSSSEISNSFVSSGINQTLHRIMLDVSVSIYVMIPGNSTHTNVKTDFCIAETLIVGTVPDSFADLNISDIPQK